MLIILLSSFSDGVLYMKVILAGYNVDREILEGMKQGNVPEYLTPETLSAAYARISRDPEPVDELRRISREEVAKARKSNLAIVFGMGHHSVAEHAVFNFDILGLSRLAVEELEKHRLCSYTEKSQRYITLEGDFVTPKEFSGKDLELFLKNMDLQNQLYFRTYPQLLELQKKKDPEAANKKKLLAGLEGKAKEDARYCLGFAIEAQLGFTANARNLEYIIRDMRSHPLEELRELSAALYHEAKQVAPSLIILADKEGFEGAYGTSLKDDFLKEVRKERKEALTVLLKDAAAIKIGSPESVRLIEWDRCADDRIINALIFSDSKLPSLYIDALLMGASDEKKKEYLKRVLNKLSEFDALPREWEMANFEYETVISASCFAQMKRHRMMTLLPQAYDPELGCTLPDSVLEAGLEKDFQEVLDRSSELYHQLSKIHPEAAVYALTNAHRRRCKIKTNARELYAISRLREDGHAQWDIRDKAEKMIALAKEKAPLTMMLACGKDKFAELRKEVYEK